jgi:hypothetical protein
MSRAQEEVVRARQADSAARREGPSIVIQEKDRDFVTNLLYGLASLPGLAPHTHAHTYTHTHTHTYIYIHIHTHMYAHTHGCYAFRVCTPLIYSRVSLSLSLSVCGIRDVWCAGPRWTGGWRRALPSPSIYRLPTRTCAA